jgi:hypothetical protein
MVNQQKYDKALEALVPGSAFSQATISVVQGLASLEQAVALPA